MKVSNGLKIALLAIAVGLEQPPDITLSEWAGNERVLPSESSGEHGKWKNSRVPFLNEIMDTLSPSNPCEEVMMMASAQTGKTEVGINFALYVMDTQTSPMLCVQPTETIGKLWSIQRLSKSLNLIPRLLEKLPNRSRDSSQTILMKTWAGGLLRITGGNSASGLRAMPVRFLFFDEIDAAPLDVEGEGDPVSLATARTSSFPNRKIFLCSTPTSESNSRIYKAWLASDQRKYFVSCPHCQHEQTLEFENLIWHEGQPETALYYCTDCGAGIEEHHKTKMLENGRWIAQAESNKIGFHVHALYTPIGLGYSWAEIAAQWELAKKDPAQLKTFTNVRKGWVSKDPTEKLDEDELYARREPYKLRTVPHGVCLLTAGVDVQKNRLAVQIIGTSRGNAVSIIDYIEIMGDPTRHEVWDALDKLLDEPLLNPSGFALKIKLKAVDTGYLTDEVMNFIRTRRKKGYFGIKGSSIAGKSIISTRPSKVDLNWKGVAVKQGGEIWAIGGDTAKATIFARLAGDREKPENERLFHFADDLEHEYFRMLTAEVYDTDRNRWIKIRRENEALDTLIYAMAAAMHPLIRVHTWTDKRWNEEEAKLNSVQLSLLDTSDMVATEIKPNVPIPPPIQHKPPPPVKEWRKSFATHW